MLKIKLKYSDGKERVKTFDNWDDALWYIHNEGDHLIYYEEVKYADQRRRESS